MFCVYQRYQRDLAPPLVLRIRKPSSQTTSTANAIHYRIFTAKPAPKRITARSRTKRTGTI
jgi:hypothetical protein